LRKGKTSHYHGRRAADGQCLDKSGNFELGNKYLLKELQETFK